MPVWAGRGAQVPEWYLLGMNAVRRLGILWGLDCCGRKRQKGNLVVVEELKPGWPYVVM